MTDRSDILLRLQDLLDCFTVEHGTTPAGTPVTHRTCGVSVGKQLLQDAHDEITALRKPTPTGKHDRWPTDHNALPGALADDHNKLIDDYNKVTRERDVLHMKVRALLRGMTQGLKDFDKADTSVRMDRDGIAERLLARNRGTAVHAAIEQHYRKRDAERCTNDGSAGYHDWMGGTCTQCGIDATSYGTAVHEAVEQHFRKAEPPDCTNCKGQGWYYSGDARINCRCQGGITDPKTCPHIYTKYGECIECYTNIVDHKIVVVNISECSVAWDNGRMNAHLLGHNEYREYPVAVASLPDIKRLVARGVLRIAKAPYGPLYCNHANECPARCPCAPDDCYCFDHSCKNRCPKCGDWTCTCA